MNPIIHINNQDKKIFNYKSNEEIVNKNYTPAKLNTFSKNEISPRNSIKKRYKSLKKI